MLKLEAGDFVVKLTAEGRKKFMAWYSSHVIDTGQGGDPGERQQDIVAVALDQLHGSGADFYERLAALFNEEAERQVALRLSKG